MSRRARHFQVDGGPFGAQHTTRATVSVIGSTVVVRPLRWRRTFELPLDVVAKMIVERVVKAEVFKARIEKAKERRARRGRR